MNATLSNVRTGAPFFVLSTRRPTPVSVWLPYLALLATVAALNWGAPKRVAAFLHGRALPQTSVNYPLPLHDNLLARR